MDVIPHNFARPAIGDEAQVGIPGLHRQIGNVGYPNLLRAGWNDSVFASLQQIGMSVEAMMALGGFVIGAPRWHQITMGTQNGKQFVPADVDTLKAKQKMQLSRPNAGMA